MSFSVMAGSPDGKRIAGTNFRTSNPAVYDIETGNITEISGLKYGGDPFYINNKGAVVGQAIVDYDNFLQ